MTDNNKKKTDMFEFNLSKEDLGEALKQKKTRMEGFSRKT